MERPYGFGEPNGFESHRSGKEHCRSYDCGGKGGSFKKDHGGRKRRNPGIKKYHQHDGGSAQFILF
jgi:hypothetical protein